jgi:hypothetical protein
MYVGIVLDNFHISNVVRYIFNVWEAIKNPYTHIILPPLIYSKINNRMIKFIYLSCTFSMIL